MKKLQYLNEERSTVRDAAEKEAIRGYPHLEMLHSMRMPSTAPKHTESVIPKDVNIGGSIVQ